MTNRNILSKPEPHRPAPLFLRPTGKDYLWGGSRLNDDFAKGIDLTPLAETWECSTHPDGPSYVCGGPLDGQTLARVLEEHPDYLGTHPTIRDGLPILVKFIDAKRDLSVQVHPDDDYARTYENGQLGKSEMWYVLDAAPGACLIYGLTRDMTPEEMCRRIADGTLESCLQKVPIHKNDVFFVRAGTIHAIGGGALVTEIQESSNLTYRLYDYDRVDKTGKKRPLHVDKALAVADLKARGLPTQPMRVLNYRRGSASELLGRCKYFEVHRLLLNTERVREMVPYRADSQSFRVLLCLDGCGSLQCQDGTLHNIFKGDCIFFPADSQTVRLHGRAQFLDVRG